MRRGRTVATRALGAAALGAICLAPTQARASAPSVLGFGGRNAALARANVADAGPAAAPIVNPAFAWRPGTRLLLGYGYGRAALDISGRDAGVRDISGTDIGLQTGGSLGTSQVFLGGGLTLHVPDGYQARIAFRSPTEPQYPLYDASPQRTVANFALALRYKALSLGVAASVIAGTGGEGARFQLAQDAQGTYVDSRTGIDLPYQLTAVAGLGLDLGPAGMALRVQGPRSLGLHFDSVATVDVQGSPLNGVTDAEVTGDSGYEPLTVALGARVDPVKFMRVFAALEYARWSAAPPPSASIRLNLDLAITPQELEARFVAPRFRDTLSPQLGLELRALELPAGAVAERSDGERPPARLAIRAGWSLNPSPVPNQTGFTSYADSTRQVFTLGAGYHFGRPWGVELQANAALGLHVLALRHFDKQSDALPMAHYTADGRIYHAALSLEGAWR
jgi:hypothetical protein